MNSWQALIYGILQGLTEFLPVSSSGHLAILPHYLGINDPGVIFDLLMHLGTALAVIFYFYKDIKGLWQGHLVMLLKLFNKKIKKRPAISKMNYCFNFFIATVTTVVLAFAVKYIALNFGRSVYLIAFNLAFFGILMFVSDLLPTVNHEFTSKKNVKQSIIIGLAQVLALFPGVSRSGITLTAARFLGVDRKEAARFSFLLSLPLIFGGMLIMLPKLSSSTFPDFSICLIGLVSSFITGWLAIHFFIKLIDRFGLLYFSVYRVLFALVIVFTLAFD